MSARTALRHLTTFRNANHRTWFVFSSTFAVATFVCWSLWNTRQACVSFSALHLGVSFRATRQCLVLREPSEVYSVDCIWFNALLGLAYLCLGLWM